MQSGSNMATLNQTSLTETGELFNESCSVVLRTPVVPAKHTKTQGEPTCDLQTIYNMLLNVDTRVTNMNERLHVVERLENRLSGIETLVQNIPQNLSALTNGIKKMELDIAGLNTTMAEFKSDLQGLSDTFDNVKEEVTKTANSCTLLSSRLSSLEEEFQVQRNLQDRERSEVLDLKCRSMQKNLLFCGIQEAHDENCEEAVKNFITRNMEITSDIQFDRVHRLGQKPSNRQNGNNKPRKIVAAFTNYKDREMIRSAALSGILKDTGFSVFEQFPMEIEEKRRTLYPVLKDAKRHGQKVRMVRDRLFINNKEYKPRASTSQPPSAGALEAEVSEQNSLTPAFKRARKSSTPE